MSGFIYKVKGNEIAVTSANSVANATCVRLALATGSAVVTLAYANGTQYANLTVVSSAGDTLIQKSPTDTIAANVAVQAVAIAFRD
jgi:hypothetical protein